MSKLDGASWAVGFLYLSLESISSSRCLDPSSIANKLGSGVSLLTTLLDYDFVSKYLSFSFTNSSILSSISLTSSSSLSRWSGASLSVTLCPRPKRVRPAALLFISTKFLSLSLLVVFEVPYDRLSRPSSGASSDNRLSLPSKKSSATFMIYRDCSTS